MAVTGDEFIEVPVLMWGRLRIYNVKRNQRLIDWITLKEQEWWSRHIVREQPVLPDVEHPTTLSLVKQIYNIRSQTSIELSDVYIEILDEYQKQCDIHNAAKRASDRELVKILAAMNEFETGFLSDGRIIQRKEIAVPAQMRDAYTYKRIYVRELQNRKGILVKEIGNEKRTEEGNAGAGEGDSKSADHNGSVRPDAPKL
jgi:predicted phage-related endonuclease